MRYGLDTCLYVGTVFTLQVDFVNVELGSNPNFKIVPKLI